MKAILYWLHDKSCSDPRTSGYVGVTTKPEQRFSRHRKHFKDRDFEIDILFEGDEDVCYEREQELRPRPLIGWNKIRGGRTGVTELDVREYNSLRMKNDNPVQRSDIKAKLIGNVTVRDKQGRTFLVKKNDPRYVSGELVSVNKGKVTVCFPEGGKAFHVNKNDPRLLSGELVQASAGISRQFKKSIEETYSSRRGRQQSEEERLRRSNSLRGTVHVQVECPYCGVSGGRNVMNRWHFERCKNK